MSDCAHIISPGNGRPAEANPSCRHPPHAWENTRRHLSRSLIACLSAFPSTTALRACPRAYSLIVTTTTAALSGRVEATVMPRAMSAAATSIGKPGSTLPSASRRPQAVVEKARQQGAKDGSWASAGRARPSSVVASYGFQSHDVSCRRYSSPCGMYNSNAVLLTNWLVRPPVRHVRFGALEFVEGSPYRFSWSLPQMVSIASARLPFSL